MLPAMRDLTDRDSTNWNDAPASGGLFVGPKSEVALRIMQTGINIIAFDRRWTAVAWRPPFNADCHRLDPALPERTARGVPSTMSASSSVAGPGCARQNC